MVKPNRKQTEKEVRKDPCLRSICPTFLLCRPVFETRYLMTRREAFRNMTRKIELDRILWWTLMIHWWECLCNSQWRIERVGSSDWAVDPPCRESWDEVQMTARTWLPSWVGPLTSDPVGSTLPLALCRFVRFTSVYIIGNPCFWSIVVRLSLSEQNSFLKFHRSSYSHPFFLFASFARWIQILRYILEMVDVEVNTEMDKAVAEVKEVTDSSISA